MESKGRRVARAAGPIASPAQVSIPVETSPETAKPIGSIVEEFTSAEPSAEIAMPAAAAMALPSAEVPAAAAKRASSDGLADFGRETFAALVQSQTAVARGLEALTAGMTGLAISGIDAAARTATDMLGVKTLSDAMAVNAGFTRKSVDNLLGGSAKLSELGVRLATEASHPILTQFGRSWIKAARFAF